MKTIFVLLALSVAVTLASPTGSSGGLLNVVKDLLLTGSESIVSGVSQTEADALKDVSVLVKDTLIGKSGNSGSSSSASSSSKSNCTSSNTTDNSSTNGTST